MSATSPLTRESLNLLTRYSLEISEEYQRRSSFTAAAKSSAPLSQRLTSPLAQYSAFAKRSGRLRTHVSAGNDSVDNSGTSLGGGGGGSGGYSRDGNGVRGGDDDRVGSRGGSRGGSARANGDGSGGGVGDDGSRNGFESVRHPQAVRKGERQSIELGYTGKERRKRLYRRTGRSIEEKYRNWECRSSNGIGRELDDDDVIEVCSMQDLSCALRVESLLDGGVADDSHMEESAVKMDRDNVWLGGKVRLKGRFRIKRTRWMELEGYNLKCCGKAGGKVRWVQDMRYCGVWYNLDYHKVVVTCRDGTKITWYTRTAQACWKWVAALQYIRKQRDEQVGWVDDQSSTTISDDQPPR